MSLESDIREPVLRDNFTDFEQPEFKVDPGMYYQINDGDAIANYTDKPITVSVKLQNGRRLIGFHV